MATATNPIIMSPLTSREFAMRRPQGWRDHDSRCWAKRSHLYQIFEPDSFGSDYIDNVPSPIEVYRYCIFYTACKDVPKPLPIQTKNTDFSDLLLHCTALHAKIICVHPQL